MMGNKGPDINQGGVLVRAVDHQATSSIQIILECNSLHSRRCLNIALPTISNPVAQECQDTLSRKCEV